MSITVMNLIHVLIMLIYSGKCNLVLYFNDYWHSRLVYCTVKKFPIREQRLVVPVDSNAIIYKLELRQYSKRRKGT